MASRIPQLIKAVVTFDARSTAADHPRHPASTRQGVQEDVLDIFRKQRHIRVYSSNT
jgi:hypothetical protein